MSRVVMRKVITSSRLGERRLHHVVPTDSSNSPLWPLELPLKFSRFIIIFGVYMVFMLIGLMNIATATVVRDSSSATFKQLLEIIACVMLVSLGTAPSKIHPEVFAQR